MEMTSDYFEQVMSAYRTMFEKAKYRAEESHAEPSDGLIEAEAEDYAFNWFGEENSGSKSFGHSCHYPWRRAMIYAIEAARLMCLGEDLDSHLAGVRKTPAPIVELLRLALDELQAWEKEGSN